MQCVIYQTRVPPLFTLETCFRSAFEDLWPFAIFRKRGNEDQSCESLRVAEGDAKHC